MADFELLDIKQISDLHQVNKVFHDVLAQERAIQVRSVS
jgi:hypothetical protein